MAVMLNLNTDVLPVLAAFQAGGLYGTVSITFEGGQPTSIDIREKMRLADQVRSWLRRVTRRSQT